MQKLLFKPVTELSDHELSEVLFFLNEQYRAGRPQVSDQSFDLVYMKALAQRLPEHELITTVQPEPKIGAKGRVIHPVPMLSTDKAYTREEVQRWLNRVIKAGESLGIGVLLTSPRN